MTGNYFHGAWKLLTSARNVRSPSSSWPVVAAQFDHLLQMSIEQMLSTDVALYRLYRKVCDEIEGRGGKVVRVRLDYEIKRPGIDSVEFVFALTVKRAACVHTARDH
jgi:hypothetical protein